MTCKSAADYPRNIYDNGDTYEATCWRTVDGVTSVADLTLATAAELRVTRADGSTLVKPLTIAAPPTSGVVRCVFMASDFPEAGQFVAKIHVTYGGGQIEVVPTSGYLTITVTEGIAP